MPKRKRPRPTFTCPTCGADVPEGAAACPECGADEETGWSQDAEYDEANLPDPDEDAEITYESAERLPDRKKLWVIILVAVMIVIALLWGFR